MAVRAKIEDGSGAMGDMPDIQIHGGKLTEQVALRISAKIREVIRKFNNGLSMGSGTHATKAGNLDAQYIDVLVPSGADTEFEVPHGLLRKPIGFLVVRKDRACDIYDSQSGSWTDDTLYLKSSVANATVRLLVF